DDRAPRAGRGGARRRVLAGRAGRLLGRRHAEQRVVPDQVRAVREARGMGEPKDGVTLDTATDNYDNWTWKQIKLAICGDFAVGSKKAADATAGISDPESLLKAAGAYAEAQSRLVTVQSGLEALQKSVKDTWKGKGAKGFNAMLDRFKSTVDTVVDSLRGVGAPSYVESLINAGGDLARAIYEVNETDAWGANETVQRWQKDHYYEADGQSGYIGEPPWHTDADGTTIVAVSTYPDIVDEMNKRMRVSINKLGKNYKKYSGDLRDPGNPNFDTGGKNDPPDPPNIKVNIPDIKVPPPPK